MSISEETMSWHLYFELVFRPMKFSSLLRKTLLSNFRARNLHKYLTIINFYIFVKNMPKYKLSALVVMSVSVRSMTMIPQYNSLVHQGWRLVVLERLTGTLKPRMLTAVQLTAGVGDVQHTRDIPGTFFLILAARYIASNCPVNRELPTARCILRVTAL